MVIPFRRVALYSVAGFVLLGLIVSGYLLWSTRIARFPGLGDRVTEYYALEAKHQWKDTYAYRVPVFRKTVPIENYVTEMEEDAKGWTIQSTKILYAVSDQNRVKIKMYFKEVAPKGYFRMPSPEKFLRLPESERLKLAEFDSSLKDKAIEVNNSEWSVWENIDGVWYAWETGARSHLSLNHALVAPN